jgi:hypothetical protein
MGFRNDTCNVALSQCFRIRYNGSATRVKQSTKAFQISKFGEIDGVRQLRRTVGGANPPLRFVRDRE